jgi:L-galactono-1,4-lactone dehydrogenase
MCVVCCVIVSWIVLVLIVSFISSLIFSLHDRWTARSTAPMSPAYSPDPEDTFCWVGVILYVPSNQDAAGREAVRRGFVDYCRVVQPVLEKYNAQVHWAKIELPDGRDVSSQEEYEERLGCMKSRIRRKYPVDEFVKLKKVLDPEAILSNNIVDSLFD